jgi:hypothetical protein
LLFPIDGPIADSSPRLDMATLDRDEQPHDIERNGGSSRFGTRLTGAKYASAMGAVSVLRLSRKVAG